MSGRVKAKNKSDRLAKERQQIREQIKFLADEKGISYKDAERIYNNSNLEKDVKEITINRTTGSGILGNISSDPNMMVNMGGVNKTTEEENTGGNGGENGGGENPPETWKNPWENVTRRAGRRGVNERLPSDLRYPYSTINGTQDFIKFSIFEYRRSTQSKIGLTRNRGDRLFTSGRESLEDEQNNLRNTRDLLGSILLPIPSQVADTNSVGWGESRLNTIEANLLAAAGGIVTGDMNNAKDSFAGALNNLSANKDIANNWFAKQAINSLIGSNITLDQLLARDQGEIINPNMELLFSGPALRSFSFNFKLTPRYQREAEVIRTIIKAFKRNMAAKGSGGTVLRTPNIFQLEYVGKAQDYLNRMKLCALRNVSVNYTGDGTFATYQDGAPISSMLTLQFTELTPIYNEDYGAYIDNRDGVGY